MHDCEMLGEMVVPVSYAAGEAGSLTREILGSLVKLDMKQPVVSIMERGLNYKFMAAEAYWMLTGDDRVDSIAPYCKHISKFSDDGITFFGAYGPKIFDQMNYIIDKLQTDPMSRQAVINIWRESPPLSTRDVPCTISVQFMRRDGKLQCFVNMRSSDVWLGFPYDVFNFSILSGYVARKLGWELGNMYHYAASRHVYEKNIERWKKVKAVGVLEHSVTQFNPEEFAMSSDIVVHLKNIADNNPLEHSSFKEIRDL